jgi:hypothetical protein
MLSAIADARSRAGVCEAFVSSRVTDPASSAIRDKSGRWSSHVAVRAAPPRASAAGRSGCSARHLLGLLFALKRLSQEATREPPAPSKNFGIGMAPLRVIKRGIDPR